MAERRMFSKKIINSAKFIKMPNETQSLYFHLGINADDDGVVEAYTIMRLIGATDDSLKILSAKGFVRVLNDDLVTYLTNWNEHNLIRADRKVDSIYKNLLLEIVPDAELITPKQRADRQRDVPMTTKGQHRIGKDRVVEVSIEEKFELKSISDLYKIDISYLKDFIAYRKKIKKSIKTKGPISLFAKELNLIRSSGIKIETAISMMHDHEWQTIKLEYINKPKTDSRDEPQW